MYMEVILCEIGLLIILNIHYWINAAILFMKLLPRMYILK